VRRQVVSAKKLRSIIQEWIDAEDDRGCKRECKPPAFQLLIELEKGCNWDASPFVTCPKSCVPFLTTLIDRARDRYNVAF
jgi:hypothetical protein